MWRGESDAVAQGCDACGVSYGDVGWARMAGLMVMCVCVDASMVRAAAVATSWATRLRAIARRDA